tara:strand:+ start:383 stop:991 length:609 start_codon:yes stop_codon:yes gene_type:complete
MGYKRPFDLLIILCAHVFPLTLVIWILVWLIIPLMIWGADRGPIFYRQQRVGRYGKAFSVWKFRTMVRNADTHGLAWTVEGDHRITSVGRFLRRTGLDELPQLINVIRGEMSLVGPRPLAIEEQLMLEHEMPEFASRLDVVPGITGLAQLYNREDDDKTKLAYDIYYIQNMGPVMDVKLLLLTVMDVVLRRRDVRTGKDHPA